MTQSFFSVSQTKSKKKNQAKKTTVTTTPKATTSSLSTQVLTETDVSSGLKEALTTGAKNAASQLTALDGFNKNLQIRIPFPPDVAIIADKLKEFGYGKEVDDFELTLNRAAEQASKDAAPIFVNAISQMTITDATTILTGPDNAATNYLQSKTGDALFAAFSPTVKNALGNSLATSKWTEITTLYNKLPFVTHLDTDLVKYTTNKALSGLFFVLAGEEKKIRDNPSAQTTDILKKVFGNVSK
jgi:hypothetical protein